MPSDLPFLWGAATSSHQVEGGNCNDWTLWEEKGFVEGGIRSGKASDHWNRFAEDLRLASEMGLNTYRFSIEWSRVEPKEGEWNQEALEWYGDLIRECERHHLIPMVTLHHFTYPQWVSEKGGSIWAELPGRFERYTRKIAKEFGSRVPLWCTVNEPMVLAIGAYLGRFMPPAEFSRRNLARACRTLLKMHALAYQALHQEIQRRDGPWKDSPLMVGFAHNIIDFHPDRPLHPIESLLCRMAHQFYNRYWLDAVTGKKQKFRVFGLIRSPRPVQRLMNRTLTDFIGVNYYTKAYLRFSPFEKNPYGPSELPIDIYFARRNEQASDLGWSVHPEGFRKVLRWASKYKLPIFITENGIADRTDKVRKQYIVEHLKVIKDLLVEGLDVRGYYHWSLLDNFEWIKGFGPRFGLIHIDYETFLRTPKESARVYSEAIRSF